MVRIAADRDDDRADAVVARGAGLAGDDDELVDGVALDDVALLAARARRRSPSNVTVAVTAAGSNEPRASAIASEPVHLARGDRAEEPRPLCVGGRSRAPRARTA